MTSIDQGWKKIPSRQKHTTSYDNGPVITFVIHGVPCQRPIAEIIQDVGVRGIMEAL